MCFESRLRVKRLLFSCFSIPLSLFIIPPLSCLAHLLDTHLGLVAIYRLAGRLSLRGRISRYVLKCFSFQSSLCIIKTLIFNGSLAGHFVCIDGNPSVFFSLSQQVQARFSH